MAKKTKEIKIPAMPIETMVVTIEGDSDLILNRMSRRSRQDLLDKQAGRPKNTDARNDWEDAATALHWNVPLEGEISTEEDFAGLFEKGQPCISAFGFGKTLAQTVSRFGFDAKGTEFAANVQVVAKNGLIPIKYAEHHLDEKLIPSNTLARTPVRSLQNRFVGWSADITFKYVDNGKFSIDQILQIVQYAGFGIGIGAARTEGNGRYHIVGARGE